MTDPCVKQGLGKLRSVGCTARKVLLTLPASFTIRLSDLAMVDSWMLSLAVPSAKACLSNAGRPCVYKMLIQGSPLVPNLERAVLNLDVQKPCPSPQPASCAMILS